MVYYFKVFVGEELVKRTFEDFDQCKKEAIKAGLLKFRDIEGGEYFV